jgi:hypothetical protein
MKSFFLITAEIPLGRKEGKEPAKNSMLVVSYKPCQRCRDWSEIIVYLGSCTSIYSYNVMKKTYLGKVKKPVTFVNKPNGVLAFLVAT